MTTLKMSFGTPTSFGTWTMPATDAGLLIGRTCPVAANDVTLAVDYLVEGIITTTSTTAVSSVIELWVYASSDGGSTYSAAASTTDVGFTPGSVGVKNLMALLTTLQVTDGTGRAMNWGPFSVANLFGGIMPDHFGLYIVHNTGTTPASGSAKYTAIQFTNS